jgi:hypothetical protein
MGRRNVNIFICRVLGKSRDYFRQYAPMILLLTFTVGCSWNALRMLYEIKKIRRTAFQEDGKSIFRGWRRKGMIRERYVWGGSWIGGSNSVKIFIYKKQKLQN